MEKLVSVFKSLHFAEIVLMMSVLVALLVHFVFGYQPIFFLLLFSFALAFVYFPFGFYFIKSPSENYSNSISIILGFIYALGVLTVLLGAVNIDSYRYPMVVDFLILGALVVYLLFQLRRDRYPNTYINTQFLRVVYLVVISLIILI